MKALVVGLVLVVLIAAGAVFYLSSQSPPSPPATETAISNQRQEEDKMVINDEQSIDSVLTIGSDSATPSGHGFYDFYSQDGFGTSTRAKKILFFYASWCPTCKIAEDDFQANLSKLPEDVAVFKVHYNDPQTFDEDKDLAKQYGITYQHTFVQVDNEGKEITKWNGGGLDKLISSIK